MKKTVALPLCLLLLITCFGQQPFQLAPPLMKYASAFFKQSAVVELSFREPGAEIRYTLDNSEPAAKSALYTKPVLITRNKTTLKAKSFHKKYAASETIAASFIKDGVSVSSVKCTTPNEKYSGSPAVLIDNKGGIASLSAKTWLGFQADTVTVEMELGQLQPVSEILLDVLHAESSWIFMPSAVHAYVFNESTHQWQGFSAAEFAAERPQPATGCAVVSLPASEVIPTKKLMLKIIPLQKIPEWHDGKGQQAWLFIDEIKVY